jgi:LytS/YehU family sensor histidine kinase
VADTGAGISPKKGTGVGLTNIRERLKALYGRGARLVIEENAPQGVVATIEVDDPAISPEATGGALAGAAAAAH